ncbi:MAG: hypothetical protein JWQ43_2100 [Glaciihabitans sp.]|nr:hypothetical protein [Glaciihabitans sp.]
MTMPRGASGLKDPLDPVHTGVLRQLLEGEYLWGTVDIAVAGRSVCRRYRVVVYPPGTNSSERVWLTLRRRLPLAGGFVGAVAVCFLAEVWPLALVIAATILVYVSALVVASQVTRDLRESCRTVESAFIVGPHGLETTGDPVLVQATLRRLSHLDRERTMSHISPSLHELGWAEVYESIAPRRSDNATRRGAQCE